MTVNELKKGDTFTTKDRKNAKKYTVTSHPNCKNPVILIHKKNGFKKSSPFYGMWMIILDGCGQLFLADDVEIKLVTNG